MNDKIQVKMGTNIKREAVLIDPSVNLADPSVETAADASRTDRSNIIATGTTTSEIMQKLHGGR